MSAYVIDIKHIAYLCAYYESARMSAYCGDKSPLQVANLLLAANYASVNARYRETDAAPELSESDIELHWGAFNPVQVIKAAVCLDYQSCEVDGWEQSEACDIINRIIRNAVHNLPGYDDAKWGAPEPMAGAVRLSRLMR
jgi:hypothetical protein